MTFLPTNCALCKKRLRYASSNKKAMKQGLPVGAETHDHDAKSKSHFGHMNSKKSRPQFKSLQSAAWKKMGVKDPNGSLILCFECHEVILHNPVLSETQLDLLSSMFKGKTFDKKVFIFNRVLDAGLNALKK